MEKERDTKAKVKDIRATIGIIKAGTDHQGKLWEKVSIINETMITPRLGVTSITTTTTSTTKTAGNGSMDTLEM